ncbi:ribosome biogenesis GTPase Der [Parapedomonas caeni]
MDNSAQPTIVIIGRPNVGKSTLFNRLVGKRLALVDDTPGVTRDRREGQGRLFDMKFTIVDTAGLEEADAESLAGRMRAQTEAALAGADLALMVIDARAGLTPLDRHFATWLRSQSKPVVLLANKAEGKAAEAGFYEAYELGLGEPVGISAEHGEGMADLYQALVAHLGLPPEEEEDDTPPAEPTPEEVAAAPLQLAIVGRPNAGKSTLVNRLIGEDRLVTGPEAGITRDSIAIPWEWKGRPVKLIDTAGLRRRARVTTKLEKLSAADTKRAIDFAEVVVLLLDSTLGLEAQDLKIADQVLEEGRALVIALNKWDAVDDQGSLYRGVAKALEDGLSQVKGVPLITCSGATGKGLDLLLKASFEIRDLWSKRVSTAGLNRWFSAALERNPPPAPGGKRIKLRYITQARIRPPSFVVFGNRLDDLPDSYHRYLVNSLRDDLGFAGVPIRITFKSSDNPFARKDRR